MNEKQLLRALGLIDDGFIEELYCNENVPRKKYYFKRPLLIAAIIAMILVLAGCAAVTIFGAGDWFRSRMNEQLKEDQEIVSKYEMNVTIQETISQGQVDVVNELGQNFREQTVTSNGTTITMTAAYGDAYVLHLYLKVEAPEGTVLPDGIAYEFYDFYQLDYDNGNGWWPLTVSEDAPYKRILGVFHEMRALPDDDPTDNKKDFEITLKGGYSGLAGHMGRLESAKEGMAFNDGVTKYLNMTGIYEQVPNVDGEKDGYIPFATGDFSFDIGLINEAEMVELDVDGLTYGGHVVNHWTHPADSPEHDSLCPPYDENGVHTEEWDYSVTANRLILTPLSALRESKYTCTNERKYYPLEYQVVMKDGTSPLQESGNGFTNQGYSIGIDYFTTPIDFDQVDYIEIGDPDTGETYKVKLPR